MVYVTRPPNVWVSNNHRNGMDDLLRAILGWGARVAVTLLVYRIGAGGCREHGDARVRWETRVDGWFS